MTARPCLVFSIFLSSCANSVSAPATTSSPPSALISGAAARPSTPTESTGLTPSGQSSTSTVTELAATSVSLPGATGPISIDFIAYEPKRKRVWVPVGDTGSVDVFDIATNAFTRVDGFKTVEREAHGKTRVMGPSSVSVGDGVVYIGNRGTSEVCSVDEESLKLGHCIKLSTPPDCVAFVAATKEVWVTTPKDQSLTILDASNPQLLKDKIVMKMPGQPEGYAVDQGAGVFYTNLEDKNQTLVIDIKTHTIQSSWDTGCGDDGPRGVAFDSRRKFVFVACTSGVQILDGAHAGSHLGKLETGAGVDNIEYLESTKSLYVAAGKAARLTVARVDDKGQPTISDTGTTALGARNAVVDPSGNVFLVDSVGARLLVFTVTK